MIVRKNIRDLKPYEPGKPIKELERELGIREADIIKLASNENPIGPSPRAVKAMEGALKEVNRYPDGSCFYLKKRLAARLKVRPQNLIIGNGSDELIDIITKAFLEERQEALMAEPSFLEYKIVTRTRGAKIRTVPLEGFRYNIEEIARAITKDTKLIFLGNPDNPTGAYLGKKDLSYLLARCPKRVILVFDEAYRELTDAAGYSNPVDYIKRENIIVLRTFSKAYGLAGLRIGYAIAGRGLTGWMERVRQPFNVNLLAQIAAEAAISDTRHLSNTRSLVKKGKRFLIREMVGLGCEVAASPANFILFSAKGIRGTDIFKRLLCEGVIIRDMKPYGIDQWARVNIGTMPENRKFIRCLAGIINKR
jgi:histidinol-phosphate aminotransferase